MGMPEQSNSGLSADRLFEEVLPIDISIIMSPVGFEINGGYPPYDYKWIEGNLVISSDSIAVIRPMPGKEYALIIIDSRNCTDTVSIITEGSVGIEENTQQKENVSIYYSPSSREVVIEFHTPDLIDYQYDIYDSSGIRKATAIISGNTRVPSNYVPGLYIVRISGGPKTLLKKIIIP